ncbi:MAG: electron transfer flavoprotein subunit beta/FixA family protein [Candidatus Thiodiazotropha sp. (ex Cardiolucina cf. quadrata)]|nr:electron transfer flavoprotein subunit beta/FixA family protein [Candidatus Thiodiazotropha sp. (ex Cardiolucina cf. quadrata)]
MKILVSVKRVIDANVRIQVKADNTGVDSSNAKMAINPFDEIALEEAVRLKESGKADSVVAVTVGNESCLETLRTALAMGADRAVRIDSDIELEPLAVAKLLAAVVAREAPGMVLLGKQAIDDDNNQTGQMLAALLGWGQGTFASDIELAGNEVEVNREIDGGLETIALKLPAVITTDLRLNEPRYVKLPNIMKAKKKPLDLLTPGELGVDVTPRLTLLRVEEPLQRGRGVKVADVSDLVDKLRNEARVI